MAIIYCPTSKELVSFNQNNTALVINIYEQEDGILVAADTGSAYSPNIEALLSNEKSGTTPLDVFKKIHAGEVLIVDELFVGEKVDDLEDGDEDLEEGDADEANEGSKPW